jgi:Tfp pilus assembly protein PilF
MIEQKKTRRQLLEGFLDNKPDDAFSRYGLALDYVNTGETAAADSHFKLLLEKNPDYVPAYLMYAQMLAKEARTEEAKQVLAAGIRAATKAGNQHARSEMEALLTDLG